MKRLMILMVMGVLCLNLFAQDQTEDFYKQGEIMLGFRPSYGSAAVLENGGQLSFQSAFSNTLRIGYFVKDKWLVGIKSSQQIYTHQDKLKINVPNVALYTRYYAGKGAWRAFFELETGVSQGYRSTPNVDFEQFNSPYLQGSYGVAFRPGKGRMSLELSNALFNISPERTNLNLIRPQLGINFHF